LRLVASCPVGSRSEALRAELALKRLPKAGKIAALTSPKITAGATFKTAVAGKKAAKKT
jgi:predicted GIY-YIG superfamily endonuclease